MAASGTCCRPMPLRPLRKPSTRAAMPRPKSPESPVHRARTTATLPPRSVRALVHRSSQLAAMSRSRREVPSDGAQPRSGILHEIQDPAANDQVEGAVQYQRLQSRVHLLVEPRTCESEHRPGRVHAAEARDARAKERRQPAGAAADVEHGIGGPGVRELDDGIPLAREYGLTQAVRPRGEVPSGRTAVEVDGALYVSHPDLRSFDDRPWNLPHYAAHPARGSAGVACWPRGL